MFNYTFFCVADNKLCFSVIKDTDTLALNSNFLGQIKKIFNIDTFVETGTYRGYTSIAASKIFKQVYSVELGFDLYIAAKNLFQDKNIHLTHGDSVGFLKNMIPSLNEPMIIFLDAHYSGSSTSKGNSNTPIIDELNIIKERRKSDCVVLVDDIRLFNDQSYSCSPNSPEYGYPNIRSIIQKGNEIFANLGIIVFGDIMILYDSNVHNIKLSGLLKAMTEYKIKKNNGSLENREIKDLYEEILRADKSEIEGIKWLMNLTKDSDNYVISDFLVWNAFLLMRKGRKKEALILAKKIDFLQEYNIDKIFRNA